MNLRKHMTLVVGGGIELVLLVAVVVLLVRFNAGYLKVRSDLKTASERLDQLNRRDPFPSTNNVRVVEENRAALQGFLDTLQRELRDKQVEAEKIEPSEFVPLLERTGRRLNERAQKAGTKLPPRFAFGFDLYAAGQLPAPDQLPRLVTQVKTVEAVCNVLLDARVSEIASVKRQTFEVSGQDNPGADTGGGARRSDSPAPAADQAVPMPPHSDLYEPERIEVSFLARENNYWDVLNQIARSKPFMVVADAKLENPPVVSATPPVTTVARPNTGGPTNGPPVYLSHEDRVIGGRENVRVTLTVDVYRFSGSAGEEAKK